MHEQMKILLKYILKCHLGPTKHKQTQWDKAESRKLKNFDKNKKFSQPLSKYPNPRNPRIQGINDEKPLKHTLDES